MEMLSNDVFVWAGYDIIQSRYIEDCIGARVVSNVCGDELWLCISKMLCSLFWIIRLLHDADCCMVCGFCCAILHFNVLNFAM